MQGSGLYSEFYARSEGDVVGRKNGYPTIGDAVRGATAATAGPRRAGAAIFEQEGRFYASSLTHWGRYDDRLGLSEGPWHFEDDGDPLSSDVHELRAHRYLRMLVDGATVLDPRSLAATSV